MSAAQENQELLGRLATACLDDLMSGKRLENFTVIVPPFGAVERASTATMASEDREVAQAVEFIRAHDFELINISDVLQRVNISRVTIKRRFRQVIGDTPRKYLIKAPRPPRDRQSARRVARMGAQATLQALTQNDTGATQVDRFSFGVETCQLSA